MRLFIFFLFSVSFFSAKAATIKWDGEGADYLWSTASNWDGNVIPGASDDVILDNSNPLAAGTYTVTLPNTAVTVRTLTITPVAGITQIFLLLPSTNAITSNAFIAEEVIINAGGTFDNNATVTSGTNLNIVNSIRINDGGYYIHRTQSDVSGWVQKLSTAPGTEYGIFLFAVPASTYAISLGGLNFGTLVFGISFIGTIPVPISYSVNGSGQLDVRGDLNINAGATVSIAMQNDIIVQQNFQISNDGTLYGTLDLQTSSYNNILKVRGPLFSSNGTLTKTGIGTPQIELNGTSNQLVGIAGDFTNSVEFNVNNPAGITLLSPVTLPYKLILTNGKIRTAVFTLLTLADNATCSGGSSISNGDATTSFVEGPMKKIGDDNFIFPVGVGSIYAPIGIINAGGELPTDEFTAKYIRSNPQTTGPYGTNIDPTLDHINYVEYWTLDQDLGSASKKVSLDVHPTSFCKSFPSTYVSHWDGTMWKNEGSMGGTGTPWPPNYHIGTITSFNAISSFSPSPHAFTLATDLSFDNNPLPVHLISFDAVKINERKASLTWELATYCSPASIFEIQRAERNRDFLTIGKQNGSDTNLFYNYYDNGLKNGINYYRLKMIDEDRKITYSSIKAIMNGADGLMLTSFVPSIVRNAASLTVTSSGEQRLDLIITDMLGRTIKKGGYRISAGNTNIELSLDNLAAGIYQLTGTNTNGKTNTIRFIKQ